MRRAVIFNSTKVIPMTARRYTRLALMALGGVAILIAGASLSVAQQGSAPATGPMVANSQYDSWAPFGVGASSTLSMIETDANGSVIRDSVQTQTVTTLTDSELNLATQAIMRVNGQDHPSPVHDIAVPAMIPDTGPPAGTQTVVAAGTQSVTVPAGTFPCTLTTTTITSTINGQSFTTVANTWTNDQVPGSVVKMISESSRPTGDVVMTYELVDYTLGTVTPPPAMEPNPEHATWASFPVGATATYSHSTFDGAGVEVGTAVSVWTLDAMTADSVTISNAFTTQPGTPDEYTCTSGDIIIPATVPAGSNVPGRTTTVVVAAAPESITVPAGTFQCVLTTTTTTTALPGGQICTIITQEWTNDTVPGGTVKSTSLIDVGTGSITTVMELTAQS